MESRRPSPELEYVPVVPAPDRTRAVLDISLAWVVEAEDEWKKLKRYERFVLYCIYHYGMDRAMKVLGIRTRAMKKRLKAIRRKLRHESRLRPRAAQ